MIPLQTIKEYFDGGCKTFAKLAVADAKLSAETKRILYEIGIPNHKGYAGDYVMLDALQLVDSNYLQFATRDFDEDFFRECIDLKTGKVVFNLSYDGNKDYHFVNTDLESYLRYVYTYAKYMNEIEIPQKLGDYRKSYSKYAKELNKQFLAINKDVATGFWADLIEEMDLGVI